MTVAVSCNLSDGVVLGVDSAVTLPSPTGVLKVYEEADKLFQISNRPIGVATFGLGTLRDRTIGSLLRQFELMDPHQKIKNQGNLAEIVEELRAFFYDIYLISIARGVEEATKKRFDEIPVEQLPVLGFVVGGFSPGSYMSEVWGIHIPRHKTTGSADQLRKPGGFGTNWFAMYEPIQRYFKGYTPALLDEMMGYFSKIRGSPLSESEAKEIAGILSKYEYQVPYASMPIREGIEHVRFLVSMVVNHHRFAIGAPIVGGKVNIGLVTYDAKEFKILRGEVGHVERRDQ